MKIHTKFLRAEGTNREPMSCIYKTLCYQIAKGNTQNNMNTEPEAPNCLNK